MLSSVADPMGSESVPNAGAAALVADMKALFGSCSLAMSRLSSPPSARILMSLSLSCETQINAVVASARKGGSGMGGCSGCSISHVVNRLQGPFIKPLKKGKRRIRELSVSAKLFPFAPAS